MPRANSRTLVPQSEREAQVVAYAIRRLRDALPDHAATLEWQADKTLRDYVRRAARARAAQSGLQDVRGHWVMRPWKSGPQTLPGRGHVVITWGQRHVDETRQSVLCGGSVNGRNLKFSRQRADLVTDPPDGWKRCETCARILADITPPGAIRPTLTASVPEQLVA